MDKHNDELRYGEGRFTKDIKCDHDHHHHHHGHHDHYGHYDDDCCDYCETGKKLIDSAICMENSLAEFIADAAKKPGPPHPPCPPKGHDHHRHPRARILAYSSVIEIIVLIKLLIGIAVIHHDKISDILEWIKDNVDINDIDFKKLVLFFKNQDWDKIIQMILTLIKNNTNIKL